MQKLPERTPAPILFQPSLAAFSLNTSENCPKLYSTLNLKTLVQSLQETQSYNYEQLFGYDRLSWGTNLNQTGNKSPEPKLQIPKCLYFWKHPALYLF